nr:hypothetical protein [Nanoarchaeum sp.]
MIKLEEFVSDLKDHGFESVLNYYFKTNCYSSAHESYNIFANLKHGLLLDFQTSSGGVGSGRLHYELNCEDVTDRQRNVAVLYVLLNSSSIPCYDDRKRLAAKAISIDHELTSHIHKFERYGLRVNNPWKFYKNHNLFLLDSKEAELPSGECKRITRQKIRNLPTDVQVMIGAR